MNSQSPWKETFWVGLIAGVVVVSVSAIGMVETFNERDVITDLLTLGQILLFGAPAVAGFLAVRRNKVREPVLAVAHGALAGLLTGLLVVGLILLMVVFPDIRSKLVNLSQPLLEILTFGQGAALGSLLVIVTNLFLGVIGAVLMILPERPRTAILHAVGATLALGLLSEILRSILQPLPRNIVRIFIGPKGIEPLTAVLVLVLSLVISYWWQGSGRERVTARRQNMTPTRQRQSKIAGRIIAALLLLGLPFYLGQYLTEVVDTIGLFILMGFGLNIVVGFAGLLDLGYVAFYAIGAYTMGLLTSSGDLGIMEPLGLEPMSFWLALPICILAATAAGVILGTPVLRMRGDYLAIVTLGFGEIIRVLVISDLLKPVIGGAQGILQIENPQFLNFVFFRPQHFYYIILGGCVLAAFVSWRLRDARLGRRWMAMREDEDVAEAMGIHLVSTKLLAFGLGAAFAGLAGAIFASKLGSIFPNSFELLISINVLSLIIVGGMGSLPGVVVGALVLVGLPELLREFAEYRLLIYGAVLIAMMVAKPEGLWPSPVLRRELHADEEESDEQAQELMEVEADGAIISE